VRERRVRYGHDLNKTDFRIIARLKTGQLV
jgi:hypothetical protein